MRKTNFLLISAALACAATAQADEGTMTALLPDGVTINFDQTKRYDAVKNLCVAGSPEKGYRAFFAAKDADHGEELWVTDGTVEGTKMVKDIMPGVATSNVQYLTRFNDKVVFSAIDPDSETTQPWISDGTAEGTYVIKAIHEFDDSNPAGFTQINETQFIFFAQDYESQNMFTDPQKWLYISDGTEDGTKLVKQVECLYPGREDSDQPWGATMRVGRRVFFKGNDSDKSDVCHGDEIWVTDGTAEGTFMIMDINLEDDLSLAPGSTIGCAPNSFQNYYNEKLFFKAWSMEAGNEPWASDGTTEGTYMIYDTDPTKSETGIGNGGGVAPVGAPYNGMIFFRGKTPETGCELGITNCDKGNFKVIDIYTEEPTASHESYPDPGVEFDGYYVFCAATGFDAAIESNKGGELHYTDGNQVWMQYDLAPGNGCDWVKELTVCGGSLYWWNEGSFDGQGATSTKLIRLDAIDKVPQIVSNIHPDGDKVYGLRNLNGSLLFSSAVNNQLYCYTYRQEGYDPAKNPDVMEPVYNTRSESSAIEAIEADRSGKYDILKPYPNPATTTANLGMMVDSAIVYNMAGQVAMNVDAPTQEIGVEGLASGLYIVVAKVGDVSLTGKLIVK